MEKITHHDRATLRRLAGRLAELAQQPAQQEKIALWTALNDLKPQRPMLWITEIPWREFEDEIESLRLQCESESCRGIEQGFRRKIFVADHLPCDEVVEDIFRVGKTIRHADYDVPVSERLIAQGKAHISAHHYQPVISDFPDIEKIKMPQVEHDAASTDAKVAFAESLFGDILQVRACGVRQHWFNAWDNLVRWTGVTEALMDLVQRPDYIHALMRRITDSYKARMRQLEEQGLLDDSRSLPRVGSGGPGYTSELPDRDRDSGGWRLNDQWGGATPQIFSDVSPEMHQEFALRYEIEIMEQCGLNYYGCCEPLQNKMDILAEVPRLRKISISPWCDVAKTVARSGRPYVFSHKPSPAIMAEDRFNPGRAEKDIRDRLARSGEMPCEFIMKDISTVRGDVARVIEWCRTIYPLMFDR